MKLIFHIMMIKMIPWRGLQTCTAIEPALQHMTRFDHKALEEIVKLRDQGNKHISSIKKKNKLVIGNVHYYHCSKINDLYDVDDEVWCNVRYSTIQLA